MQENNQIEILVVEDNPNDVELMLKSFDKHNLRNKVYVIGDGAEALDFIFCKGAYKDRSIKRPPKVVILDLKLPKVNGKEVLRQIKSDEKTKVIPVVIMTSSQEESDVFETYKLGANSYIVKPVDFTKLGDMIANLGLYWLFINKPPL